MRHPVVKNTIIQCIIDCDGFVGIKLISDRTNIGPTIGRNSIYASLRTGSLVKSTELIGGNKSLTFGLPEWEYTKLPIIPFINPNLILIHKAFSIVSLRDKS